MGPRTTAGCSSWRFMESVGGDEASDCKRSMKFFLNSSCLISSVRGIGILIFCISCTKLKEDVSFGISLISGTCWWTMGGRG